jgi:DNA-binding transcriptional LysR family regulator
MALADRLTGIEVFVTAIRTGSLSAAGRALGISAAMATRHLDALEARLGIALVVRTTRRLALTDAGVTYLDRAERVLADLRDADDLAAAGSGVVEGLLRVSVPVSFCTLHIAPLIAGFTTRHPGVIVELGLSDRYVDLIEQRWDVAIRIGRHLPDSSMTVRTLAKVHSVIVAAPAYLEAHGIPRTVADLADHDCMGFTLAAHTGRTSWAFGQNGEIKVPVHGRVHADNGDALIAAAVAGQGLVYGPRFIAAPDLAQGRLVELTLDHPLCHVGSVFAVTHPTRIPLTRVRAWIDFLASAFVSRSHDW